MITDVIVGGFLGILRAMILGIPIWEPPGEGVETAASTLADLGFTLNGYFPVMTLWWTVLAVLGFRVILFAYSFIREAWDALPLT